MPTRRLVWPRLSGWPTGRSAPGRLSPGLCRVWVTPDLKRWQEGYGKGLEYYCIPELAYAKEQRVETTIRASVQMIPLSSAVQYGRQGYLAAGLSTARCRSGTARPWARQELWRQYRHSDDPHVRRELHHRLRTPTVAEMERTRASAAQSAAVVAQHGKARGVKPRTASWGCHQGVI